VQFVNQSNVEQPSCHQMRESLGRQVRGEEIRRQEVTEESRNNPQNNGTLGEGPGFFWY